MCAIFTQSSDFESKKKVVASASQYLTETEKKYSQIKSENLAILFGYTKFQVYFLEKHFKVLADHKPLLNMFNDPRSQVPFQIEKHLWNIVEHTYGNANLSRYLSRYAVSAKKEDLRHIWNVILI